MAKLLASLTTLVMALAVAPGTSAQCEPEWQPFNPGTTSCPGLGSPLVSLSVCRMWDADGQGPGKPKLVVGGDFAQVGDAIARCIAVYDPDSNHWSPLGSGVDGRVFAVATLASGDLVAGGSFLTAGASPAKRVARWDGNAWHALGSGVDGTSYPAVHALATTPSGDLFVGGNFTSAGAVATKSIARWDGGAWSALGSGLGGNTPIVHALAATASGELFAGGAFATAGGIPSTSIARWDRGTWSGLGSGMGTISNATVYALAIEPSGDVVAAGFFQTAGGTATNNIARWNGSAWSPLGSGVGQAVYELAVTSSGDIVAGGIFWAAGGQPANKIARWDGSAWSAIGEGMDEVVNALAILPSGDLIAGGYFQKAGSAMAQGIARWNGNVWSPMGLGFAPDPPHQLPSIYALATLPSGDVVVGGHFSAGGATPTKAIARWDGDAWTGLGSGLGNNTYSPTVYALLTRPSGNLIAAGRFLTAGGSPAKHIAQWDGQSWSPLGSGMAGSDTTLVLALASLQTGDLAAAGNFVSAGGIPANFIAQWDGSAWSAMDSGLDGRVLALAVLPSGDLIAGGEFFNAGGKPSSNIARWNGHAWSAMPFTLSPKVTGLAILPSGDLIACTTNDWPNWYYSVVYRWDGVVLSPLRTFPEGGISDLVVLPSGHLVVAGRYLAPGHPHPDHHVERWDGNAWWSIDPDTNGDVSLLEVLPSGDLVAGGSFTSADGVVASSLLRWSCKPVPCYPDCDASGSLNIDDFLCFQMLYTLGDPIADCDRSGSLNIDDFICFQTEFALGC